MEGHVPTLWNDRLPLWVAVSHKFGSMYDPFIALEIQQLGLAERLLLDLEQRAIKIFVQQQATNEVGTDPYALSELVAHSRLWIFGIYETLRTFRQKAGKTDSQVIALAEFFRRVELARIPLAKHEPKGMKKNDSIMEFPNTIFCRDQGWIGCNVRDPKSGEFTPLFRTELANRFLAAMA